MAVPTQGEELSKLIEHVRLAQESAYMMAHLTRAMGGRKDKALADGWFSIGELFKRVNYQIIELGKGKLQ